MMVHLYSYPNGIMLDPIQVTYNVDPYMCVIWRQPNRIEAQFVLKFMTLKILKSRFINCIVLVIFMPRRLTCDSLENISVGTLLIGNFLTNSKMNFFMKPQIWLLISQNRHRLPVLLRQKEGRLSVLCYRSRQAHSFIRVILKSIHCLELT